MKNPFHEPKSALKHGAEHSGERLNQGGSAKTPRLAILLLKNLSSDLDDYFTDGLTEDIAINLSHFSDLRVISSSSSIQFKARNIPLSQLVTELDVDYVVDSSVRRAGSRIHITVQLMDAVTGESVWVDQFDRGIELSLKARKLNPLHPGWYYFSSARYHFHHRTYDEVLADIQRINLPDFYWTHLMEATALGQLGRPEANASLRRIFTLKPKFSAHAELRKWNASPKDFASILVALRKAGRDE